jgi:glutamate--cysteine ligase
MAALSTDVTVESPPVSSVDELVGYFASAAKEPEAWRVGTEHEMIGVRLTEPLAAPVPYEGEHGIRAVLADLAAAGWEPVEEGDTLIGLRKDGSGVSLEPGGQFEHASAPVLGGEEFCAELRAFRAEVGQASRSHHVAWLSVGFRPFGRIDDVPWMPKRRYRIMREYLGPRGALAHEMMKRTATVQVNLDFADSDDAASKLRCAFSITSLLTALYANSPIVDGRISGYQSYRGHIWHHTDPDRCGLLPFAFEDGCVFRAYAEWALDVPMFFVFRDGEYIPAGGATFRRFMHEGLAGHRATLSDWAIHLSTLFPEARLKSYLEIRGCDAGSHGMIAGLGPLCSGLLYDPDATAAATALTASLSFADRLELSREVARAGLGAAIPGRPGVTAGDMVRELVAIAADGLGRVAPHDLHFLGPIEAIAASGRSQADVAIDIWRSSSDPAALISALAYPGLAGI